MARIYTCFIALVIWFCLAAPLWAQIPQKPGQPQAPGRQIVYGSYIAVGLLMAAVGIAAFKNSKRSHQD